MIQETQARKKGKHQLEHFIIFESKRSKPGGGSMMGIHESMNPALINMYEDDCELIVVQTKVGQKDIRFITGYGPQEDWSDNLKALFLWHLIMRYPKLRQMEVCLCSHGL